jgi:2-succinyl-5-enolpyruvyl-6-hydroxy-3-cyclohexene-1-carboxylate synthase
VILCPGSRNAPLTLSFSRHPHIQCFSLVDERSAGFTALGMAVALGQPLAIVCTSGTAVLNLYPAITEAFYSQIPLLVITADRPPEWIDQWDGQCIRQTRIFEKHILGSFTFNPLKPDFNFNEAIGLCSFPKKGPAHINVPLSEPLYDGKGEVFVYDNLPPVPEHLSFSPNHIPGELTHKKILLLAGADAWGERFKESFKILQAEGKLVVLADVISGLHDSQSVTNWDAICTVADDELKQALKPDLLITIGKFTVSKSFKKFIRAYKPKEHWHVTNNHTIANPFETTPTEIEADETVFLEWLAKAANHLDTSYTASWMEVSENLNTSMDLLFKNSTFNEFSATRLILENLPKHSFLHVANSMPVRFVSFLAGKLNAVKVYGNRGTSGIDGSTSTTAGTSMMSNQQTFLLTGDISFFYDINGLWNQYLKPNFKIIVLNNGGGGIFRLIDGPHDLPEREDYFATQSIRNCQRMADEFKFRYYKADDFVSLQTEFETFCNDTTKPGILEIFTKPENTIEFYKQFKDLKIK